METAQNFQLGNDKHSFGCSSNKNFQQFWNYFSSFSHWYSNFNCPAIKNLFPEAYNSQALLWWNYSWDHLPHSPDIPVRPQLLWCLQVHWFPDVYQSKLGIDQHVGLQSPWESGRQYPVWVCLCSRAMSDCHSPYFTPMWNLRSGSCCEKLWMSGSWMPAVFNSGCCLTLELFLFCGTESWGNSPQKYITKRFNNVLCILFIVLIKRFPISSDYLHQRFAF